MEAAVDGGLSPASYYQRYIYILNAKGRTYSSISQLTQRRFINLLDLLTGPVGSRGTRCCGFLEGDWDPTGQRASTGGTLNGAIGASQAEGA